MRTHRITHGRAAETLLPALEQVLTGQGSAMLVVADGDQPPPEMRVSEQIDDDIALVVATSGTTGTPKGALLSASALAASANSTHRRLGGLGTWLLALPADHIAGLQVLVRSVLASTTPVELDVSAGFDVTAVPDAVNRMQPGRRYTSMVPVQLAKALDHPGASAALAQLDAVLLGGGPAPRPILEAAANVGITVVRTYGMSETSGGCVYDGLPLDGVSLAVGEDHRVRIGGSTVAKGYRNPIAPDPFATPGWFVTDDLGSLDAAGALTIHGRADDGISTGGLTVLPHCVEIVLAAHPAIGDCAVFGVPDDRLGQRVVAAVVLRSGADAPTLEELRACVADSLDATAAPRELHIVETLPRRGIGKVDRTALARLFGTELANDRH